MYAYMVDFRSSIGTWDHLLNARRAVSTAVFRSCLLDTGTGGFGWLLVGLMAERVCSVPCN